MKLPDSLSSSGARNVGNNTIYRTNNYSQAILFYNTVTAITGRATEVIASHRGMVKVSSATLYICGQTMELIDRSCTFNISRVHAEIS